MGRNGGGRPAMSDVARAAGVSHQTVSRVLNSPGVVKPETRARVEAAIASLGYRRNLQARALATSHTSLIGVVGTALNYFGPASVITAVEEAARGAELATLVGILRGGSPEEVSDVLESFVNHGVEGIIVVAPYDRAMPAVTAAARLVPTVVVADGAGDVPGCHTASVDQALGARLAVEHLVARGCERIAHVSGPLDWFDARARLEGWRTAVAAAGLDVERHLEGDWSAERGYELGRQLAVNPPDGIFCANDLTALGLLSAFADAGVAVPEQTRVVGFDGIDGTAFFAPALTTVRQPFAELGLACIEVLVAAMAGAEPAPRCIPPTLVERASTAG